MPTGTLEPAGKRTVTVDGQQFLPNQPEKRLYPVHFCRECGHDKCNRFNHYYTPPDTPNYYSANNFHQARLSYNSLYTD